MGLSICEKIVKGCEGKIECFSQGDNKGSTFAFTIKMKLPSTQKQRNIFQYPKLLDGPEAENRNSLSQILDQSEDLEQDSLFNHDLLPAESLRIELEENKAEVENQIFSKEQRTNRSLKKPSFNLEYGSDYGLADDE